jgi:hypothetical protein
MFAPVFSNEPAPEPSERCDVLFIDFYSWIHPHLNALKADDGTISFQVRDENGLVGDTRNGDLISVHRGDPYGGHLVAITHPEVSA